MKRTALHSGTSCHNFQAIAQLLTALAAQVPPWR
jgi:hypothetical protein